jgi:hypothetical protein
VQLNQQFLLLLFIWAVEWLFIHFIHTSVLIFDVWLVEWRGPWAQVLVEDMKCNSPDGSREADKKISFL